MKNDFVSSKNRLLYFALFFVSLALLISLFSVFSFADESEESRAIENFNTGEWYFLEYNPESSLEFPITSGGYFSTQGFDVIVFSKDLSRIYNATYIDYYANSGYLQVAYNDYLGGDFVVNGVEILASDYYFLIKYDITGVNRIPLGSVFDPIDSPFKFSPEFAVTYRFRNATSLYGLYHRVYSFGGYISNLSTSNYPDIKFQGVYVDSFYDLENDSSRPSSSQRFGVLSSEPLYPYVEFPPSSSYIIALLNGDIDNNLGMLYYYLDIPLSTSPYTPPPSIDIPEDEIPQPSLDVYATLSQFQPVVQFIVDIFNGIDALEIFPGFSVLDVCFAYISIYVIRFFLKLVAGG